MSEENRHYAETQNPKARSKKKSRRTRFGDDKNDVTRPHPVPTLHPDDLPQRARWTIIITAGLLLITCMLLVGVTLRMAPVIDELGIRYIFSRINTIFIEWSHRSKSYVTYRSKTSPSIYDRFSPALPKTQ